ncbi:MAG TPA: hypothetical protein VNK91_01940 [Burkholderiaceae bacterium]|nr:hypothetical protein [Burkholderiaceae bacterium]
MSSDVDICNMALGHVGVSREINSLTEGTTEADQCRRYYAPTRDAMFRDHDWPFAQRYVTLGLVANNPNDDWGYAYRYPSNCVRLVKFVLGARANVTRVPYELAHDDAGKLIYTDQADAVVKIIAVVQNSELYDPAFVIALSWRLGAELAIPLSRSEKERDYAYKRYLTEFAVARALAGNETGADAPPEAESIRARE